MSAGMNDVRKEIPNGAGRIIIISPSPGAAPPKIVRRRPEQPEGPGPIQRTKNFTSAAARHVAAGSPQATDEQVAERWAKCQTNECGFFKALKEGKGRCLHKSCGCNLRAIGSESILTPNKLRWADQECPVGMWGAVTDVKAGT